MKVQDAHLIAWAASWIEACETIPVQDVEEREGSNDLTMWRELHRAAEWNGYHVCRDEVLRTQSKP